MHFKTLLRLAAVALLLGLLGCIAPAQDPNSDDLAAAARKAREQQKNAPKPKKVLTNDDLPSAPAPASPATATSTSASGDKNQAQMAGAADAKSADEDTKGEPYWRKRFQQQHDKIATAQKELELLQRELDKDQIQYYSDPQKALKQQFDRSDINEKTAKIDAKKKEIDALNQQLSDMEDELRKVGGDPGWAR